MEKFTQEETLNIFDEIRDTVLGRFDISIGTLDGEPFFVVESWEDLTALEAAVNGYRGNLDLAASYYANDLIKDLNKAVEELKVTERDHPDHCGTIYRLDKQIKQLSNLAAYRQWLHVNEIEEKDLGVEVGFSDEYCRCGHCGEEIVRTSPDSYSWVPPLFLEDVGYVCLNCSKEFTEDVKEEYKNVAKNLPDPFQPEELGLVKVNQESFENGLYGGQCDDPRNIIKALNAADIDVWFTVFPSQFDAKFDVYVEEDKLEEAITVLQGTKVEADEDPAELCKRALQSASVQMAALEGDGIKYAALNSDGTASVKLVSREDFIKGIK